MKLIAENDRIIIQRADPRKSIKELFEGFEGTYAAEEISWGEPTGEEIW